MWIYQSTSSLIAYKLAEMFAARIRLAEFIMTKTCILSCAIKIIDNDSKEKPDRLPTKL